jgi:O-antigen/teichoic acid export membrane protein
MQFSLIEYLARAMMKRINQFPLGKRLAHGAFWTLLGSVAARLLSLPVSVALARMMGAAHYGELGVIQSSVDFFGTFAGFGLGLTATKHVAEFRESEPNRAGRVLALSSATAALTGVLAAVLVFFLAPWISLHTLSAPHLANALRIGAVVLFFTAVTSAQSGALYGFEAFRASAHIQAIVGALNVPLVVGGYWLGGLKGVLWGMAAAKMAEWLLKRAAVRSHARRFHVPIHLLNSMNEIPILWKYSIPALISGALVAPVYWICSAILVNQPHGYAEMGVFNAANQWYGALLFLPVTLGASLLPLLSDRLGRGDTQNSASVLSLMLKLNGAIMAPVVLVMSFSSPYIMRLYGSEYRNAWSTLVIVILTAGIFAVLMPVGDVIAASGRMWLGCLMNTGWAVVFIGSTLLFVRFGSFGLASARLLAYSVHAIWTFAFAYKVMRRCARSQLQRETCLTPYALAGVAALVSNHNNLAVDK